MNTARSTFPRQASPGSTSSTKLRTVSPPRLWHTTSKVTCRPRNGVSSAASSRAFCNGSTLKVRWSNPTTAS
jgi:hypothetical protein